MLHQGDMTTDGSATKVASDRDYDAALDAADGGPDYADLRARVAALTMGETDPIALMATVASKLHRSDARFDWTGFYRVAEPGVLKIGPYQGGHGCTTIPFEKGICGVCARTGEVQIVPDVDDVDDHIACSSTTRSEIVLPVRDAAGTLIAVLDIDSDEPDAFDALDATGLAAILNDTFSRATPLSVAAE